MALMDDKPLTGKVCSILDEETRLKMQANMDAQHNRIIQIGAMRFGEGLSDLGREREQARRDRNKSMTINVKSNLVALDEVRQIFTFAFGLPTWMPDGFTMNDKIRVPEDFNIRPQNHIAITASHPDGRQFSLSIHLYENAPNIVYGPRSVEENALFEVRVNGQPAALITRTRGFRLATGESIIMDHPRLVWMIDDVHYELSSSNSKLSTDEMIRIAESIKTTPL
jgi:hypothetical protein